MWSILWTFWRLNMPSKTNLRFRTLIWSHSHINRTYGHISWQNNFMCGGSLARHSARMPGKKLVAVLNQPWSTQPLSIQHMIVQHCFSTLGRSADYSTSMNYLNVTAFLKEKLFDVHPPLLVSHLPEDPQPIIKSKGPERSFNKAAVKLLASYSIGRMFDRLLLPTARCTVPRVHVFAMSFRRGGGAAYALFVVAVIGIMLRSTTGPMMLMLVWAETPDSNILQKIPFRTHRGCIRQFPVFLCDTSWHVAPLEAQLKSITVWSFRIKPSLYLNQSSCCLLVRFLNWFEAFGWEVGNAFC